MTCGGGGDGCSRGEEGASFRKGWDLPSRGAAARPRLILGSLLRGLPARAEPAGLRVSRPSGSLIVTRGWSRAWAAEPLLSRAFVDALAGAPRPTKGRTGSEGSSAWRLFIPDLS